MDIVMKEISFLLEVLRHILLRPSVPDRRSWVLTSDGFFFKLSSFFHRLTNPVSAILSPQK